MALVERKSLADLSKGLPVGGLAYQVDDLATLATTENLTVIDLDDT